VPGPANSRMRWRQAPQGSDRGGAVGQHEDRVDPSSAGRDHRGDGAGLGAGSDRVGGVSRRYSRHGCARPRPARRRRPETRNRARGPARAPPRRLRTGRRGQARTRIIPERREACFVWPEAGYPVEGWAHRQGRAGLLRQSERARALHRDAHTMLGRYDRGSAGGEAKVEYGDGTMRVIKPGTYVRCAVTGEPIPLDALRYWNVDRQEAYAHARGGDAAPEGDRRGPLRRAAVRPSAGRERSPRVRHAGTPLRAADAAALRRRR
jgi:hypothetical protein